MTVSNNRSLKHYLHLARLSGIEALPRNQQTVSLSPVSGGQTSFSAADPWKPLAEEVEQCTLCAISADIQNHVFGQGDAHARIMFVGEAPGADEDKQGLPFVGRAGQLLTDIITKGIGIKREDVYIANVLKCRPPGNRNPQPDEIANCIGYLKRQVALVKPEIIITLGKFATHALLDTEIPISRLRGTIRDFNGVPVMPTFHPSYLLRNPSAKKDVWEDIQKVMRFLGMKLPS